MLPNSQFSQLCCIFIVENASRCLFSGTTQLLDLSETTIGLSPAVFSKDTVYKKIIW